MSSEREGGSDTTRTSSSSSSIGGSNSNGHISSSSSDNSSSRTNINNDAIDDEEALRILGDLDWDDSGGDRTNLFTSSIGREDDNHGIEEEIISSNSDANGEEVAAAEAGGKPNVEIQREEDEEKEREIEAITNSFLGFGRNLLCHTCPLS